MRIHLVFVIFAITTVTASAQNVGINVSGLAPAASALLDIDGAALPANAKRGLLIPRIALSSRTVAAPVVAPAASLVIYNTATTGVAPNNVYPGYYYWNGTTEWLRMFSGNDAWSTTGNTGTTAGTNFIGTNDAKDFVVKTGGSAATNERMRVLAGGQVVVNKATAAGGDVFSVYASNTGGLNNSVGLYAVNGYTNDGYGVYGEASNAVGLSVLGSNTSTTGTMAAVQGQSASRNGRGVIGLSNTTPAAIPNGTNAIGVQGQVNGTLAPTGQAFGVYGITANTMISGSASGVLGATASADGNGVWGNAANTTGKNVAVRAQSYSRQGTGVLAITNATPSAITANTSATGVIGQVDGTLSGTGVARGVSGLTNTSMTSGNAIGVQGQSASQDGTGVIGLALSTSLSGGPTGVMGQVNHPVGAGVQGENINLSGTGIVAAGQGQGGSILNTGSGSSATGFDLGSYVFYTTPGVGQGITIQDGIMNQWDIGGWDGTAYYKIRGPGSLSTTVENLENEKVLLYCPEAPEVLFQDFGVGQLTDGVAHVSLDPVLTKNILVNDAHPMKVFIQLEGDCKGVYVTNKSANGFDVKELQSGTSSVPFSWSITATRADETTVGPNGEIRHSSYRQRFGPALPHRSNTRLSTNKAVPMDPMEVVPATPGQVAPVGRH